MKGVLSISNVEKKFVYQGVHMIVHAIFDDNAAKWGPDEPRVNKMVFIGKNLDKDTLRRGFEGCLDSPENQDKVKAIEEREELEVMGLVIGLRV